MGGSLQSNADTRVSRKLVAMRKTAREKLEIQTGLPKIKSAPVVWGGGRMLIPHPTEVDALIRKVGKGKLVTLDEIRTVLARKHGVDICCPMTAGIFVNVVAAAAEEDRAAGKRRIAPYWRCLKKNGELNPKFPDGCERQRAQLEVEGHFVVRRGKRLFVADYEEKLADLPVIPLTGKGAQTNG